MPYFCQEQKEEHFRLAGPVEGNQLLKRYLQQLVSQNSIKYNIASA